MAADRDLLVRVRDLTPKPPIQIILGVDGCPCIHLYRRAESDNPNDLIDVEITRGTERIEAFALTRAEQARFFEAWKKLTGA